MWREIRPRFRIFVHILGFFEGKSVNAFPCQVFSRGERKKGKKESNWQRPQEERSRSYLQKPFNGRRVLGYLTYGLDVREEFDDFSANMIVELPLPRFCLMLRGSRRGLFLFGERSFSIWRRGKTFVLSLL